MKKSKALLWSLDKADLCLACAPPWVREQDLGPILCHSQSPHMRSKCSHSQLWRQLVAGIKDKVT